MAELFGKTKTLENEIDRFYDSLSDSVAVFKSGISEYLDGDVAAFQERLVQVRDLEHICDELRREIRYKLYTQMLIPESRGDVLGLLENSDNVIDTIKKVLNHFDIEQPQIPDIFKPDFLKLSITTAAAVDEMVSACRAFFRDFNKVNDYINKVYFYEGETDRLEEKLKRSIFQSNTLEAFSRKVHMRYFIEQVAKLSDKAEDVVERLSVSAIKRTL